MWTRPLNSHYVPSFVVESWHLQICDRSSLRIYVSWHIIRIDIDLGKVNYESLIVIQVTSTIDLAGSSPQLGYVTRGFRRSTGS